MRRVGLVRHLRRVNGRVLVSSGGRGDGLVARSARAADTATAASARRVLFLGTRASSAAGAAAACGGGARLQARVRVRIAHGIGSLCFCVVVGGAAAGRSLTCCGYSVAAGDGRMRCRRRMLRHIRRLSSATMLRLRLRLMCAMCRCGGVTSGWAGGSPSVGDRRRADATLLFVLPHHRCRCVLVCAQPMVPGHPTGVFVGLVRLARHVIWPLVLPAPRLPVLLSCEAQRACLAQRGVEAEHRPRFA
mmetsp:Transcript_6414/g.25957  ORF Transcript_6414/g.25957 Transcript_6414/m.25957 type:complete len:247 (+) Transcript_6414:1485-2225(+)